MSKVVRIGVVEGNKERLERLPDKKPAKKANRTATLAEAVAIYFSKTHLGDCPRGDDTHGKQCYELGRVRDNALQTTHSYQSSMRIYGPWLDVHGPITGELVTRWRQNIHLRHGKTEGYANRCLDALRGITGAVASYKLEKPFMRLAVEVRRATRFKEVKKVRRCPPRDVVARVRPLLRSYMEECWYVLISRLMLRRAEMMGLMRQDYVPDERALYVVRQRGKNGVVEHRKGRGRQLKKRLSADSCKRIEWLIEHQQANVTRNGRAKDAPLPGFLFGWSDRYLDRMAKRIREELGADASLYFPKGTNCHAFRHLGVAKKIEAGVTAQGLQDALGHAYPMMAHIYMEEARRDAQVDEVEVDLGDLP